MFSPWERANPARSHGFSPLEKFFCFLKTFFKNLLTLPLTVMIYLTCKKETALFLPLQNPMKGRGYV